MRPVTGRKSLPVRRLIVFSVDDFSIFYRQRRRGFKPRRHFLYSALYIICSQEGRGDAGSTEGGEA